MHPTEFHLFHGDCLKGMAALPDACIDVVVTSPPYNLGINYNRYDDHGSRDEYLDWTKRWVTELRRVLRDDGSFFLNVGAAPSNPMLPYEILGVLRDTFVLQNTLHWIKSITVETRAGETFSAGHFKPINSRRYVNDCHEFVFHLTKTGEVPVDRLGVGVPYADKSNIARWGHTGGKDKRCRGNTWFIPYKTITSRDAERPHPATFPAQLAINCLKLHGLREGLVMLEPFLGIGHAARAAQECNLKVFVGFEIDDYYLRVARESLGLAKLVDHTVGESEPGSRALNKLLKAATEAE
ncbi:MAG TPA: site-specific DNA-methyltransferase [Verrucomicrobiae bacterium]|nr:site-specific DNA-methyltransferase [Verrucomicrobiae bacterium]